WLAQHAQANSFLTVKEHAESVGALGIGQIAFEEVCGRFSERRAEAIDFLVFDGVVDKDGECGRAARLKRHRRFFGKRFMFFIGGRKYAHGDRTLGRPSCGILGGGWTAWNKSERHTNEKMNSVIHVFFLGSRIFFLLRYLQPA